MGDLITVEQIDVMPAGGQLTLTPGAIITPAARDAAEARGITVLEAGAAAPTQAPTVAPSRTAGFRASEIPAAPAHKNGPEQVIVTAVGKNRPRILSEITSKIAELNGNVMDINQRILQDYFTTIMIVEISGITGDFAGFKQTMESISQPEDYRVSVQHEKVFQYMHRI